MQRAERVGEEIKKVVAEVIRQEIKDPRLPQMTTVTAVRMSRDLSYATVYVSSLGGSADEDDVLAVLNHARGYVRRAIGERVRLRVVPEVRFKYDNSIEVGNEMSRLIDQVIAEDKRRARETNVCGDAEIDS